MAQTQLRVIEEKMQMDALELQAFVNHSRSLIHQHLKGSQSWQGRALPGQPKTLLKGQAAAEQVPGSAHTQGCAHGESLSAKPAITAPLARSKPSCRKKNFSLEVQGVPLMCPDTFKFTAEEEIPQNCQLRDTKHQNNTEHHREKSCHTSRDKQ